VPAFHLDTNRWLLLNGADNSADHAAEVINSTLVLPVNLGEGCVIENATVGPFAVVEAGCHISHSTLRDCIVMAGSRIEGSDLHDSMIGERAEVTGYQGSLNIGDDSQVVGHKS